MKFGIRTNNPWLNTWGSTLLNYRGAQGIVSKISVSKDKLSQLGASYFSVGNNYYTTIDNFIKLVNEIKAELKPTVVDKYQVISEAFPASFEGGSSIIEPNYSSVYDAFTHTDGKIELVIFDCQGYRAKGGIDEQCDARGWTINLTKERFNDVHFDKYVCYDPITGLITKISDSVQTDKHQVHISFDFASNDWSIPMYDTINITKDDTEEQTEIDLYQTGESFPVKLFYAKKKMISGSPNEARVGLYERGTNARHFFLLSPGIPEIDLTINYTVVSDYESPEVYSRI